MKITDVEDLLLTISFSMIMFSLFAFLCYVLEVCRMFIRWNNGEVVIAFTFRYIMQLLVLLIGILLIITLFLPDSIKHIPLNRR